MHLRTLTLLILLSTFTPSLSADIQWRWQDRFSHAEQQKLMTWVRLSVAGVEELVGPYPFDIHITFHRRRWGNGPVPWANTERSRTQGVHFHVNPAFTLDQFLQDWTAPHELSHLLIPYLGSRHAWFAEGFASYMQYQVMHSMGVLDTTEMLDKYHQQIRKASARYPDKGQSFVSAAPQLRAEGKYPVMYWGGAVFFLQIDQELKNTEAGGLIPVLQEFLACCREGRYSLHSLLGEFDRLSDSSFFHHQLELFNNRPGFPDYPRSDVSD